MNCSTEVMKPCGNCRGSVRNGTTMTPNSDMAQMSPIRDTEVMMSGDWEDEKSAYEEQFAALRDLLRDTCDDNVRLEKEIEKLRDAVKDMATCDDSSQWTDSTTAL